MFSTLFLLWAAIVGDSLDEPMKWPLFIAICTLYGLYQSFIPMVVTFPGMILAVRLLHRYSGGARGVVAPGGEPVGSDPSCSHGRRPIERSK